MAYNIHHACHLKRLCSIEIMALTAMALPVATPFQRDSKSHKSIET